MARLRVIDVEIPDGRVEAVLNRFFPGAVALVELDRALPAPEPEAPRAVTVPTAAVPPADPRLATRPVAHPAKKAAQRSSVPSDPCVPLATRILGVLPGTAREIATRLGASYAGVNYAIRQMRKRGEFAGDGERGGVWRPPQTTAMPAAAARPGDLKGFLLAELRKGPRDSGELMQAERQAGIVVLDRFAVAKILDSSNEVLGGHGSRWTLAHRAVAGE
jgi:hypothetical protein